jgi:hypothetical protein
MTTYVVTIKQWSVVEVMGVSRPGRRPVEVMGVFSTREKAEAYVETLDEMDNYNAEITRYAVV